MFAPYFPPDDDPGRYLAVRRVFGARQRRRGALGIAADLLVHWAMLVPRSDEVVVDLRELKRVWKAKIAAKMAAAWAAEQVKKRAAAGEQLQGGAAEAAPSLVQQTPPSQSLMAATETIGVRDPGVPRAGGEPSQGV